MTTQIEVEDLHLHLGPRGAGIDALDGISLHGGEGDGSAWWGSLGRGSQPC